MNKMKSNEENNSLMIDYYIVFLVLRWVCVLLKWNMKWNDKHVVHNAPLIVFIYFFIFVVGH